MSKNKNLSKTKLRKIEKEYGGKTLGAVITAWVLDNASVEKRRARLYSYYGTNFIEKLKTMNILDDNYLPNIDIYKKGKSIDKRAVEVMDYFNKRYKEHYNTEAIIEGESITKLERMIWKLFNGKKTDEEAISIMKNAIDMYFADRNKFVLDNAHSFRIFLVRLQKYIADVDTESNLEGSGDLVIKLEEF